MVNDEKKSKINKKENYKDWSQIELNCINLKHHKEKKNTTKVKIQF